MGTCLNFPTIYCVIICHHHTDCCVAEDLDNNRNSQLVYSLLSEEGVFQEARPGEAANKRFSVDATSGDIIVSRQVSCDWWSRDTAAQY